MKKHEGATVIGATAVAAILAGSIARGDDVNLGTIAIKPACDCSCCLTMHADCTTDACQGFIASTMVPVSNPTGVEPSLFWNNMVGPSGVLKKLMRDTRGQLDPTDAEVRWQSPNLFSTTGLGEENNNFLDSNRALMSSYLDQDTFIAPSPIFVQITHIPSDMTAKYDVIVYTLGAVPNRGGEYTVSAASGSQTKHVVAGAGIRGNAIFNGPDFVEASPPTATDDPNFGENDWGNYVRFYGLSGDTVTITATNTFSMSGDVSRAPINGIQIIAQP
jgi:hypothetical protein